MSTFCRRRGIHTSSALVAVLFVVVLVTASVVLPAFRGGAWSPTRRRVLERMLVYADLRPGDLRVDLGAGDGRVLLGACRTPGVRAEGYEIDPLRYMLCRLRIKINRLEGRAAVRRTDFFRADLSRATVVTFYLSQAAADKLAEKFERELTPHCRVISYRRPLPGWEPVQVDGQHGIYVYHAGTSARRRAWEKAEVA